VTDQSRYSLPARPHTLRAINPRCLPIERKIEIRAGESSRERLNGRVPVRSNPSAATFRLSSRFFIARARASWV